MQLETRINDLELKKAQHVVQPRHHILRQCIIYVTGGTDDRGRLEDNRRQNQCVIVS
jgi:hypothetical protein